MLWRIDDILVHGKGFDNHLIQLEQVFQRLRDAKLKLNPRKCHLFQRKVKFLRHVLTGDGIYTDCDKIEAAKIGEIPGVYVKFVVLGFV